MAKRQARRNERPARQGGSRGSRVAPDRDDNRQHDQERRPPFLKASDIGRSAKLKLVPGSVRTLNGQYGQQVVVDVELNGTIFSWGISVDRPNMRLLVEWLVEDTKVRIPVKTLISQSNRPYIAIEAREQNDRARDDRPDDDAPF